MKKNIFLLLLSFSLLSPANAAEHIILRETFADGSHSSQNPPESLQWHGSNPKALSIVKTETGSPALRNTLVNQTAHHLVGYLPEPIRLSTGDTITLTAVIIPQKDGVDHPNTLRIGLLDSGTQRLTANSNPLMQPKNGYAAFINTGKQTGGIRQRTSFKGPILSSIGKDRGWSTQLKPVEIQGKAHPIKKDIPFTVIFTIEKSKDGDIITSSISSNQSPPRLLRSINKNKPMTSIDTIALAWADQFGDATITSITLVHSSN